MEKTFSDIIEPKDSILIELEKGDKKDISDYWQYVLAENGLKFENLGRTWESHYVKNGETLKSAVSYRIFYLVQKLLNQGLKW